MAASAGAKTRIEFWTFYTGPDGVIMQDIVKKFNESQTDIEVKFSAPGHTAELVTKVTTAILAGNPPPILALHNEEIPIFIPNLVDVTDEVASVGIDMRDYFDVPASLGVFNGRRYGITMSTGTLALYHNRDLLRAAGLDFSKPPKTKDEFIAAGQKLTKDTDGDGNIDQWGYKPDLGFWNVWYSALWQMGGKPLNEDMTRAAFNTPEGAEALQLIIDMRQKYKTVPPDPAYNVGDAYYKGKLGMFLTGPWELSKVHLQNEKTGSDLAVGYYPQWSTKAKGIQSTSHVYVFPKVRSREDHRAALTFMRWLLEEGAIYWAKAQAPPRRDIIQRIAGSEDPILKDMVTFIEQANHARFVPTTVKWGQVQTAISEVTTEAVYKGFPTSDVLGKLEKRINDILAKK
jgi:multiple sugar transport system substrate-binding protein